MHIRSLALGLFAAAVSGLALCAPSGAATADSSALVTSFDAQIRQVLKDGNLSAAERRQRFHDILDQGADFPRISCFVLGRYWPGSSDSFRQEFSRVFEDYLIQSLTARFAEYSGDEMTVTGIRAEGQHSTVVMTTFAYPDGAPVARVDWRLRDTPGGFKIEDVSDSGVSLAVSYREEFAAVISHDGGQVAALIPEMRQKLDWQEASYSTAAPTRTDAGAMRVNECTP
jgi:phospholipid transport system substrate-binding protein